MSAKITEIERTAGMIGEMLVEMTAVVAETGAMRSVIMEKNGM